VVIAFIADHRDRFGVELICSVLTEHGVKIVPSTYYAARTRTPSAQAVRDAHLLEVITAVHADRTKGQGVAGYRKMWHLLGRDGHTVARCTVERLMRQAGRSGQAGLHRLPRAVPRLPIGGSRLNPVAGRLLQLARCRDVATDSRLR
jgi:hypothetical protein